MHLVKPLSADLRIAHLSDPHFAHVTYHFSQFLSKRWLGNCNLFLFRNKIYNTHILWDLPDFLHSLHTDVVCITGDFASTSLKEEFVQAVTFIEKFQEKRLPVLFVPGNHDFYTKESQTSQRFYHYFPQKELATTRVYKKSLGKGWWWIGLDCALATSLIYSTGKFFSETEEVLKKHLMEIPSSERVIIGNHFPLFSTKNPRHDLVHAKRLQEILKQFPQVKLYLHGHDHTSYIIDKRDEGYPLVINSGSCSHCPEGTFYLLELSQENCIAKLFLKSKSEGWKIKKILQFTL